MATSTISGTILNPVGTAIPNVRVTAKLYPRPAWRTSDGALLSATASTTSASDGTWSLVLTETASITPSNSVYEITEWIDDRYGGAVKYIIQVGASDQNVLAATISTPVSTDQATYLTQAAADARYQQLLGYGIAGDLAESRPNDTASAGVLTTAARADHRHDREIRYGTAAERAALTGTDLWEGLEFRETDGSDKLYVYRAAAWLQRDDTFIVADATARTAITTPYEGMRVYQLDTNVTYRYDGSAWWSVEHASNTTTSYSPTISQVGTVTRTVTYSEYRITDGICEWWFKLDIIAGTAGTAGTAFTLTTPVTMKTLAAGMTVGNGMVFDSSAGTIDTGHYEYTTTTTISLSTSEGTTQGWGGSPSIGLATSDSVRGHVRFPIAAAA